MRLFSPASVIFVAALSGASCAQSNPVGPNPFTSTDTLILALQQQGATVRRGDALPALPCLAAKGRVVYVNTGSVSVFEYPSEAAAESDAANVSPHGSGTVGGGCAALITWVGPPHFYKADQLIVVYAGSADDVLRPLESVVGKPFATL
jgi:hypothetical protein